MKKVTIPINPAMQSYISSIPMAGVSPLEKSINLGQKIISDLNLDKSVDTLAKWIAHYLAENILIYRQTSDKNKQQEYLKICESLAADLEEHLKPPERPVVDYDMQKKMEIFIQFIDAEESKSSE